MKPSLKTSISSLELSNPTVLASGILGNTGEALLRVAKAGAGAVTTKSVSLEPRKGHNNPTVIELEHGFINAMGLPNPGVEKFLKEIEIYKNSSVSKKVLIIASIVGDRISDYVEVALKLGKIPHALELNISCPNVETGLIFGRDPLNASELVKEVKANTELPVIVKLTPNADKLIEIAEEVEKAGADAISAINTLGPGMVIDIEAGKPVLSNKFGGLSGEVIKPIAVRCIYEIAQNVKIPVIGIGGISDGKDAAEFLMAGASAVGIGTAVKAHGISVFKKVCSELSEFMQRKRFKNIEELRGIALRG